MEHGAKSKSSSNGLKGFAEMNKDNSQYIVNSVVRLFLTIFLLCTREAISVTEMFPSIKTGKRKGTKERKNTHSNHVFQSNLCLSCS
ncbi:hypothetical protein VNO78_13178 [Psophocarpus tetragonolobus]|uniref:Uncharacterized protein n=1 Tax=Psophocarpus tetragonolobus TaxID=3891 RepID=A0AAN9SPU5_PSOTE